jgi:ABC-type branched-subunit amino acid transport system substrate-binding protein
MEAVRTKVNRQGGVCGRQINITYLDDGWDQTNGSRDISGFIGEGKYFGLAVNPSSEGLRGAIDNHLISNSKFPVIGSDGMLFDQYTDPWVWPVATSTASVMHIMAANAISRGATKFGIVWDSQYRFGQEGFAAFKAEVERRGGQVVNEQVKGDQGDFATNANEFVQKCGGTSFSNCDFVAMLLEPAAADSWVEKDGGLGDAQHRPKMIGVPQPLFVNSFVRNCGALCSGMWAWTSFKPPISPFDGEAAVSTYKQDLASVSGGADASNPHVEGAYVGMLLLVDALKKLGANPTRDGMRQVLDSETLDTGLSISPIKFSPGNHFGATGGQAFEDITQGNSFANWRYTNVNATDTSVDKIKRDVGS